MNNKSGSDAVLGIFPARKNCPGTTNARWRSLLLVLFIGFATLASKSYSQVLDDSCSVNVLNRTIQVDANGGWSLPNVPSSIGGVRARATCVNPEGGTFSGESDFFTVINNGVTEVGDVVFANIEALPESLTFFSGSSLVFATAGATFPTTAAATYPDGSTRVLEQSSGLAYSSTNSQVAQVDQQGVITSVASGTALIVVSYDGLVATAVAEVRIGGDIDGDGLPDDYEINNGLNPNDPIDAFEDQDADGLSALGEFEAGTDPNNPDTDGDQIEDGEELVEGEDGFVTNPLLADSDGDGLSDSVEVAVGSDPTDENDTGIEAALVSVRSIPSSVVMTFNGIDSEVSAQLSIIAALIDGSQIDVTDTADIAYTSSDLSIVSFGLTKGEIFGGQAGTAVVTAAYNGKSVAINVTVRQFEASALSAVSIPGYANNVDISGDYAFIAAGAAGLQVVDVSDRVVPEVVAALDTDGTAIDIKVVGNVAYVADGESGLKIIDITDPLAPALLGSLDTAGVAQDLVVQLDYAYLATGNAGIEIVDVSRSDSPVSVATLDGLGNVTGISVEQDLAAVTGGSALIAIDVSDPVSPIRLGSINIGSVKDVVLANGYAHVAAYSQGYRVIDLSSPMAPRITGGDSSIAPRDVALTRNFAFYAEQLFPNVVAFINIFDIENPLFQGVIDLSAFGDFAGTGIALDASYAYITEESFVVSSDYKATGNTRLFIAQYRDVNDNNGVPPSVSITSPQDNGVVVEGRKLVVTADAIDDIAVANVEFYVDGELVFTDTSSPYQASITVPAPTGADLELQARAIDLGDNTTTSEIVSVEIQPDADGDGLGDAEEVDTWNTDPNDPDSDGDGLEDGEEVRLNTDPNDTDSDDDGIDDKTEVDNETDPLNPDITAPTVASSDPANGATDVPENNSVSVIFDEPLLRRSIGPAVLQVLPEGSATPVPGSFQLVSGNTELLFVPSGLMQDFKLHTVSIVGVKDEAGNPIVPVEWTFETGNFVDTVRPSVQNTSPTNNATDVPLNGLIDVVFSEPIIPETVTADSFYVTDQSTGLRFEGVVTVGDDKASLSFVPNTPFLVGRQYRVYFSTAIQDLFGNPLQATNRYFTTSFEADGQAPSVDLTTVADGALDVPLNAVLNVAFSEVISPLYVGDIRLLDSLGEEVTVERTLNKNIVTLDPVPLLDPQSNYQLAIDGVRDTSGNLLPTPVNVNFATGTESDVQRGAISTWSYASDAVLPLNAVLEIVLNERVDPTSINADPSTGLATFALYSETQNRWLPGRGVLSADGRHLRFERDEELQAGHRYRLYSPYNTYLTDLAGNRINGTSRRFTAGGSGDTTAPVLEVASLIDGALDIAVNSSVQFRVDEPLSDDCLNAVVLSDGIATVPASVTLNTTDRRTVTVDPSENLAVDTTYSLSLNGLCDYAGNGLTGTVVSFTTSSSDVADTAGPILQSTTPSGTGVPVNTDISVTFDEPLSQLTAPVVTGAGVTVPGTVEVLGNTVNFTPSIDLQGTTQYRIYILAVDLAGNTRGYNQYFTTADLLDTTAPTVLAISPEADAVDVSPLSEVVLEFSEPMAPGTINNSNIVFWSNGAFISPSVFRSADGQQVTLSAALPTESVVLVAITPRVTDLSGNALAPMVTAFTTSVLNTDGGRPSVSRSVPANGASGVLGVDEVVMYSNEPLDADSVEAGFHIAQNGVLIDDQGTLEVLGNGQTVRFTKDTPFEEGALIQVYLSDEATDLANNALNNYSGYFRTGTTSDGVGVRPQIQAYSMNTGIQNVPLNTSIQVLWNEPLDPNSLTESTIYLEKNYNGTRVPATISLNTSPGDTGFDTIPGQIITITPDGLLEAPVAPATSQIYYVRILAGVTDTDGDVLGFSTNRYFYTGVDSVEDDRAPMLLAVNPPDGETGVGTNPFYAVRFDEAVNTFVGSTGVLGDTYRVLFSESNQVVRYERFGTLPSNTEVTENLPDFSDFAGNGVTGSSTFTTTNGPDLANGSIATISVQSGATDVPLNPVLIRELSEPVDPVSVSANGVYLYDNSDGSIVPTTLDHSADGKRLTLVPTEALAPGRSYRWYGSGLRDMSGNGISGSSYTFTTGFAEDSTGPLFESATLFDGQIDVPTNARLSVRFDEPLNPLAIAGVQLLDESAEPVATNMSFSSDRRTVTLVSRQLLAANSGYTLAVADVEDVSANPLLLPVSIGFTTGDTIDNQRGAIATWSYASDAVLPLNAVLEIVLNERVDPTSINTDPATGLATFALYSETQSRFLPGRGVLSADGRYLRFERDEELQAGHRYRLYAPYNTYLTDLAGNRINGTSRRFTAGGSGDTTAPVLEVASLIDGALDIAVNSSLQFRVDEPLSDDCLNAVVLSDGIATVPASVTLNTTDRRTVTVDPSENLAVDTTYSLSLNGLCDYAGNGLTGTVVSFTTSSSDVADTAGPILQSTTPSGTGVPVNTDISVTFDEPLSQLTAPVVTGAGVTVPGTVEVLGNTVNFTPSIDLQGTTQYRIYILAVDLAGNTRGYNQYFTTADLLDTTAPTVLAISPEADAVDVSPLSEVVLEFSEPMAPGTINNSNIVFWSNGAFISPSVFRSADGQQVTLSAALPTESVVLVAITPRVTDLSGNALAPMVTAFTTSVLNTDGGRPSVSRSVPANGASGVLGVDEVVMYSNEPLDADSVEAGFHIAQNGVLIDDQGTLEVLGNGQTVRFTKDTPFEEGALIQVYLSDEATDLANNALNNYSGYFRTGTTSDGVGVRPQIQAYSMNTGIQNVPLNTSIQVLWNEPLDPNSLTESTIYLEKNYNGTRVPATISLNTSPGDTGFDTIPGQIITITPDGLLEAPVAPATSQIYYVRILAGVTDTDGDVLGFSTNRYFYTGVDSVEDDRAPMLLAVNPPDGETGVGTNPFYAVRFDEAVNTFVGSTGVLGDTYRVLFSESNQVVRYERFGTLPSNTEVTENLPDFSDFAGNGVTGSSTFTTTNGPDLANGSIATISVQSGATDVPLNPVLIRELSEPVDPVSVSANGVYLYDNSDGSIVPTTLDHSADGKRLTLVPTEALAPGRSYRWYGSGLRDMSGNGISGSSYTFTTGFAEDSTGPLFESATLFDGQIDVPTNARLSVRFDEPLNPLAIAGVQLLDESAEPVATNMSFSSDRRTVTLVSRQLLAANSGYTLAVADVEDVSANPLLLPVSIGFTTGDTIDNQRGAIATWSYASNAVLPLNAVLEIELNERVDPTSINTDPATGLATFALYSETQARWLPGRGVLSADGRHLRFERDEELQAGHRYRLYSPYNTYLTDLAGNRINGTSRRFTAGDVEDEGAPAIVSTTIVDGQSNVPTNARFIVSFDEPVNAAVFSDFSVRDGANLAVPGTTSFNNTVDVVTLVLAGSLAPSSSYTLSISGFKDLADNELPAPLALQFVTGSEADTTRGNVTGWSFEPDQTLSVDTTLIVTLDERVEPSTVDSARFYLRDELLGGNVPGSIAIAPDGVTLTFDPDENLNPSGQYRLYVSYSYFYDLANNLINRGNRRFYTGP